MVTAMDLKWMAIGLAILGTGCRPSSAPSDEAAEAAKKKVAAIAGESATGEQAAAPNLPFAEGTAPVAQGIHPIDQVAQGKRYRTAVRAIDRGDLATAESIRKELSTDPQYSPLATAIQGLLFVKQGKLDEAIHIAEEISAIPVMQSEAYVIAGEVYQRENRWTEATAAFENALAMNPEHVRAHRWLGAIYYDTGAMRLATTHLRAAAKLDPSDVNSLLLSAKIFQDYEQYQEAINDYQTLLQRTGSADITLLAKAKLAECFIKLRKLDEAEQVLRDAPPVPGVLASRAAIAEAKGQEETAVKLAKEALKQAPDHPSAGLILARVYLSQRNWNEALLVLQRMVDKAPYDHEPRLLLGRALVGSGQREQGEAEITRATELKNTFLKFADLHQEAIKNPNDVSIRIALGRLAEKLGKRKLAENWYRAAIGLDPTNQEAADALNRPRADAQ